MLHSPVNRLGLGLVTLTGINALIFFLLHIITHAWGGEIERSLAALGRYGSSRLFNAHRQRSAASRLPRVDGREGLVPQTGTLVAHRKGERGMRREGRVWEGCQVQAFRLGCGFAILFASPGRRTRCRAAADAAPVASPAAAPVGFWCWARDLGAGGTLHHLQPLAAAGSRWSRGRDKPWTTNPHLHGAGHVGMKLDGYLLHQRRGAGVHLQHPSIHPPIQLQLLPGNPSSVGLGGAPAARQEQAGARQAHAKLLSPHLVTAACIARCTTLRIIWDAPK